jgi:hypothetical protein
MIAAIAMNWRREIEICRWSWHDRREATRAAECKIDPRLRLPVVRRTKPTEFIISDWIAHAMG